MGWPGAGREGPAVGEDEEEEMKLSEESARAEAECMMNLRQGKVIPERQVPREKEKRK